MTYFSILSVFILPPIVVLLVVVPRDVWRWLFDRSQRVKWTPYIIILVHSAMALVYTTPWDNYLVASGVWWYDPDLVKGITLGWVPIEEYAFFILQTFLTGLWTLALMRYVSPRQPIVRENSRFRMWTSLGILILWSSSLILLLSNWDSGIYLTLILIWALIPILSQVAFGAEILLANLRLVLPAVLVPTIYLWIVDGIAIRSGTWTINPDQTTGYRIGALPIEEMLFFLITNLLVAFGVILMLSDDSRKRANQWLQACLGKSPDKIKLLSLLHKKLGEEANGMAAKMWSWSTILWIFMMIMTPISIWLWGDDVLPSIIILGVIANFLATLFALMCHWSTKKIVTTIGSIWVLTLGVEILGTRTGFPFGTYRYTSLLQPQIGDVPLIIPLAWVMMLAPAWGITDVIMHKYRKNLSVWYWPAFAFLSGLLFTAWDMYLDPQMVAYNFWVWNTPGGYFGIPWSNFLGWWISATFITVIIRPNHLPRLRLMIIYTLTWIFQAIALGIFWAQPGPAVIGFGAMGVFVLWGWSQQLSWDARPFKEIRKHKSISIIR